MNYNLTDTSHVFYFENSSNCHLKDIYITSSSETERAIEETVFAIRFYTNSETGCQNNIIEGCRIHEFGCLTPSGYEMGGGILISKDPVHPTYPLKNFIIKNNFISRLKNAGLLIIDAENIIISGNIVFDLVGDTTIGFSTNAQKYILKGNIFEGCGEHGYYPSAASKAPAFGNIFKGNNKAGVHLRLHTATELDTKFHALTGNVCTENLLLGIHTQNGVAYSSFYGNQLFNNDCLGIRIQNEHREQLDPPEPNTPPTDNCVVANCCHDNHEGVDISVSDYDKQIVANNIGNLNL